MAVVFFCLCVFVFVVCGIKKGVGVPFKKYGEFVKCLNCLEESCVFEHEALWSGVYGRFCVTCFQDDVG